VQALADSGPPPALLAGFKLGDGLQCHTEGSSWPQPHFLLPIFQICLNSSLMAFLSLFFLSPTLQGRSLGSFSGHPRTPCLLAHTSCSTPGSLYEAPQVRARLFLWPEHNPPPFFFLLNSFLSLIPSSPFTPSKKYCFKLLISSLIYVNLVFHFKLCKD
jgi:hypothetical protein